jgi:DNA-binding CsgD family transcriptional regulator
MRTRRHYEKMLAENPGTTIGFTLAADMVYAARHDIIKRSEARSGDEWKNIARNLKSKYGEALTVDEVHAEMSPVKSAAALLGSRTSEKKKVASRANAKLGGYPKGRPRGNDLTPLQQQILDLRRQGLSVREIAERTERNPENVRQVLARVARKLNIPGGWAGITKEV